jgi:hypothetical protein
MNEPSSSMDALAALSAADRSRFEALAPYSGAASLSADDAAWLASCVQRHPAQASALQALLHEHQALRQGLKLQYADLPQAVGWQRAQAAIAALPRTRTRTRTNTATTHNVRPANPVPTVHWLDQIKSWLRPSPAWAMALCVLLVPVAFFAGRDTGPAEATAPYAQMRGAPATGLFDGPLVRVNFQPQTPEHVMRETLLAQGAVLVGPTRLGDWFVKVAPARTAAVRAALAASPAVATAELVSTLPSELVDPP